MEFLEGIGILIVLLLIDVVDGWGYIFGFFAIIGLIVFLLETLLDR